MKEIIKKLYQKNSLFRAVLFLPKKVYDFYKSTYNYYRYHIVPEKTYIKQRFFKMQGYQLNIDNPKTLNEKIQWLKLHDRTPLHTRCADKYSVRSYIKEKIGEKYLIPLVQVAKTTTEIDPDKLPDYPVIIKTNHDSGTYFIIDTKKQDWRAIKKKLSNSLKRNYYYSQKEWQYKNIKPLIVIEKLLLNSKGEIPSDYKFHCFHGKAKFLQVTSDRTSSVKRNFYDTNWKPLDFSWKMEKNGKFTQIKTDYEVKKPTGLAKMIDLAEKLSSDFYYVRVDFYYFESQIYFGELTFHNLGGCGKLNPFEWDLKFGAELKLPINK